MTKALLAKLQVEEVNPGVCFGPDGWLSDPQGKELVSYNPTSGEPIARVVQATPQTYAEVVRPAGAARARGPAHAADIRGSRAPG